MLHLGAIPHGACAIENGLIVETGSTEYLVASYRADNRIDAGGRLVMPGFVDPHTHLVFAGTREHEMEMRLAGATYLDILIQGGGIHSTVRATRAASFDTLVTLAKNRLQRIAEHGTTTIEIKSGYGLDQETEERILQVVSQLKKISSLDIIATFLGAHTIPSGVDRKVYIDWLTGEALTQYKDLAEFWDVFCEEGAFTREESLQILQSAKKAGYSLKIHAGQFNDCGAVGPAAMLGAVSVDHCDHVSNDQLKTMKEQGTIAVLLPGASFYLKTIAYPDAKRIADAGVPLALATDFNPGSCPSYSMQIMIALACLAMSMKPEEAITAATINAAWAINRGGSVGSLEPGKKADCIILDIENYSQLPYHFGVNLVTTVIKNGEIIVN
jgi:imidazolonepropionase